MALAQATSQNIAVPVVAFISDNLDVQREQFILVNKAKPLPLTVELPLNGAFEFKRIVKGEWEQGANRLLFVTDTTSDVSL